MISKKGYISIKETNEDASYDSTSIPGPSSETRNEGQNDKGGVASSSPAVLELSQVKCIPCSERSKIQWTIPNNEVPKRIRDSWSDVISELKRRIDESDQQNGGEDGNRRNSGEGSDQQNGGEEGNRRSSGEGRVQLDLGEPSTNCWARFKKSYFSCARWIINSGCVNFLLAFIPWLVLVTLVLEWFYRNQCPPIPVITTALFLFGVLLACFWICCRGFPDRDRCRRCWDLNKDVWFTLIGLFVVFFIVEFVHFLSAKCENPVFDFAFFFLIVFIAFVLIALGLHFPHMPDSLRTEEQIPLRTATHEEGQNGDRLQPEAEEQV